MNPVLACLFIYACMPEWVISVVDKTYHNFPLYCLDPATFVQMLLESFLEAMVRLNWSLTPLWLCLCQCRYLLQIKQWRAMTKLVMHIFENILIFQHYTLFFSPCLCPDIFPCLFMSLFKPTHDDMWMFLQSGHSFIRFVN